MALLTRSSLTSAVPSIAPFGTDRVSNDLVITGGGFAMREKAEDRFWAHVQKTGTCWIWTGTQASKKGYGQFWDGTRRIRAHRQAWILANGAIPDGMFVCHHCDNPPCVRPDHLFLGTNADNIADRTIKGRSAAPKAILSRADVPVIRRRFAEGASRKELARQYGLSYRAMASVIAGESWRPCTARAEKADAKEEA